MFIFKNLPKELNWMIIDYHNYIQDEHELKFRVVLDVIKKFPKFVEVIHPKVCNRRTTYHHFEKDCKHFYLIKTTQEGYFSFLKKNFPVYM
jgi:hypothetical protein